MIIKASAIFGLLISSAISLSNGEETTMSAILSISGKHLSEIQAAIPEFEKRGLHLSEYQVSLLKHEDNFVVVFSKGERSPGQRGSPLGAPGFEVEVDGLTGKVVRANFVR